jgi:hypothetical protein
VGVYCERHGREMEVKLSSILQRDNIQGRNLKTEKLRFVSTECIRTCATNLPFSSHSMGFDDC